MSTDRETTRLVRSWLEEGVTALPDRVLDAVLDQLPATPQRRSWWPARRDPRMSTMTRLVFVAAALLVAGIFGWQLLPGAINNSPSPTPVLTLAPTAMAIPAEGPLAQGTYTQTSISPLRITFTVPSGGWQVNTVPEVMWTGSSEGRFSFGKIENLFADPCDPGLGMRDPSLGPTVDDLAAALASLPGLDPVTPRDVTVSGFAGKLVEISTPATTGSCGDVDLSLFPTEDGPAPLDGGAVHRFWIVDAGGTRLVIHTVARAALPQVWRNELQQIVDSIRIELG